MKVVSTHWERPSQVLQAYVVDWGRPEIGMSTVDPTLGPQNEGSLRNAPGVAVKEGEKSLP